VGIKDAIIYIQYGIKEGCYEPEQFKGWTDEHILSFYEKESDRAEAYYDALKDEG